ncbi:MAG: hypothetical protein GEV05_12035 [Betaproteobacteria bacterium]|nr:hypothetical protein [Betaproteobacteria bacterium]
MRFRYAGLAPCLRTFIALGTIALVAACASTPQATPERTAEARRFEPVTREAVIYIYRSGVALSGPETTLWVDNRLVGASLPGTFFRVIALPGRNVIDTSPPDTGRIEITTQGNDVTYVEMITEGGRNNPPNTRFRLMQPDDAKAAIAYCCWMLETWRYNQPRLLW